MKYLAPGDPARACAASSRFILPFAYEGEERKTGVGGPRYEEGLNTGVEDWLHAASASGDDGARFHHEARRRYFTAETAHVLYKRAKWFVLKGVADADLAFPSRPGLRCQPPGLVLFEFADPKAIAGAGGHRQPDILRLGMLVLEVYFEDGTTPTLNDLLSVNESLRYLKKPWANYSGGSIRGLLWADSDADDYTKPWEHLLNFPLVWPGTERLVKLRSPGAIEDRKDDELAINDMLSVYPDSRAFVATVAAFSELAESSPPTAHTPAAALDRLKKFLSAPDVPIEGTACAELAQWVGLLNVDRPSSSASAFELRWMKERTYARWAHLGTVYGFTPHSLVMLSEAKSCEEYHLDINFNQLYFDSTLLLLYVRTALFRFSRELTRISSEARRPDDRENWARQFSKVHWAFTLFENLYRYPLLSNQQQSVEMYELQRKHMDIDALYQEVRSQVKATDEMLSAQLDSERTVRSNMLNVGLAVFAVLATALAWLDVMGPEEPSDRRFSFAWALIGAVCPLLLALAIAPILRRPIARLMASSWLALVVGATAGALLVYLLRAHLI